MDARGTKAGAVGTEELAAIANRAHVERANEGRDADLHRAIEPGIHAAGGQCATAGLEVGIQHQCTKSPGAAQDFHPRNAIKAVHTGNAQGTAWIDNHPARAERRAPVQSRGHLDGTTGKDVRAASVGVGSSRDADRAGARFVQCEGHATCILNHAGKLQHGAARSSRTGGNVKNCRIATRGDPGETNILTVRLRSRGERAISHSQIAKLIELVRESNGT